jgi:hypothetical protein
MKIYALFWGAMLAHDVTAFVSLISLHRTPVVWCQIGTPMTASFSSTTTSAGTTTRSKLAMMESDFASAMPEAPELTKREFLEAAADKSLASIQGALGEGVKAVKALKELQATRNDASSSEEDLAAAIYVLMIERGMTYDEDPDTGILTETDFDIPSNLEVPEVKNEFFFLYKYGMQLISGGYVTVDKVKEIVQERLIARTGLSPEEFDAWLGF